MGWIEFARVHRWCQPGLGGLLCQEFLLDLDIGDGAIKTRGLESEFGHHAEITAARGLHGTPADTAEGGGEFFLVPGELGQVKFHEDIITPGRRGRHRLEYSFEQGKSLSRPWPGGKFWGGARIFRSFLRVALR